MNLTTAKHTSSVIIIELKNIVEPPMKQNKNVLRLDMYNQNWRWMYVKAITLAMNNLYDQCNTLYHNLLFSIQRVKENGYLELTNIPIKQQTVILIFFEHLVQY